MDTKIFDLDTKTFELTIEIKGKQEQVKLHFEFTGRLTTCTIDGESREETYGHGMAVRNPKDDDNHKVAMRVAAKRACDSLDDRKRYSDPKEKTGKKIYSAFRKQFHEIHIELYGEERKEYRRLMGLDFAGKYMDDSDGEP